MDPRDASEAVKEELEELLTYVSGYPPSEIPDVFEQLSEHFAALGICKLLITGESNGFRESLTQSGYARRFLLQHIGPDDGSLYQGLSRSDAFFDVLAAGNLSLAREIVSLSTSQWLPTRDYEEDFLYAQILGMLLLSAPDSTEDTERLIDRMEAVQGGSSPRLEVCRALYRADAESFTEPLGMLAEEAKAAIDERRPLVGEADYLFWPKSYVSIEVLGLLQLGSLTHIRIDGDIPLCPPEGRLEARDTPVINLVEEAHKAGGGL